MAAPLWCPADRATVTQMRPVRMRCGGTQCARAEGRAGRQAAVTPLLKESLQRPMGFSYRPDFLTVCVSLTAPTAAAAAEPD